MTDTIVPPSAPVRRARPSRPSGAGRDGGDDRVDPRLAERRRAVHDEVRRRRRRVVGVVALVVALVAGAVLLTRSPLLDVDRVTVSGAAPGSTARILRASGITVGDALVDVDAAAARRAVMAVPGVASARVLVEWPDAVRIRVTPERPSVSLVLPGGTFTVARGGRVTARTARPPAGLPTLDTSAVAATSLRPGGAVPSVLADALVVFEQMPTSVRPQLARGVLGADGSLTFRLEGGGTVAFGPPEEVPAKLLAAASMLDGAVVTQCLDVLDLREPTRPTISRRAGCATPAPTVGATTTTAPRNASRATTGTGRSTGSGTTSKGPSRTTTTTSANRGR